MLSSKKKKVKQERRYEQRSIEISDWMARESLTKKMAVEYLNDVSKFLEKSPYLL